MNISDYGIYTTYYPSGMYLRTIRGIFFSLSSLMAICSGSVSPSKSTRTGAFMLGTGVSTLFTSPCQSVRRRNHPPNLQSSCAQDSCPLVLRHIWCSGSCLNWDLFVFRRLLCLASRCCRSVSRNHNTSLAMCKELIWILANCNIIHVRVFDIVVV